MSNGIWVTLPPRELQIYRSCDVLVVGGGPAGVAAAIGAARAGGRVILAEAEAFLGGLGTGGSVLLWPGFCREGSYAFGGVSREVIDLVAGMGGVAYGKATPLCRHGYVTFDAELLRYGLQELVLQHETITLLHHLRAVDVLMDGHRIAAVIFAHRGDWYAIRAGVVVDATGDGNLLALSGADFRRGVLPVSFAWCIGGLKFDAEVLATEMPLLQEPGTLSAADSTAQGFYGRWRRLCAELGAHIAEPLALPQRRALWTDGTLFHDLDALEPVELTRCVLESRRLAVKLLARLREQWPGFEEAYIFQFSTLTGVRVARLLHGRYTLTDEDLAGHRSFPDCIGIGDQNRGTHHFFEIPYRCLVPRRLTNLLAAGRCLSAAPPSNALTGAFQEVREIPHCMVTGQAAGVAAALAVQNDTTVQDLDTRTLRSALENQHVRFTPDPSVPLPGSLADDTPGA